MRAVRNKQQRDEFGIDGYTVRMNNVLRKDSKKDGCFEITAPEKRVYQYGLDYQGAGHRKERCVKRCDKKKTSEGFAQPG
ncbi:Src kinase-associated phosphoprotein 2 [Acipenser ruthenus]|uniref:Src kinase-associated phosphoprotein 2 n=1 Tax=Acipenser ruthenus TaxID=7906 RepID=A0A662YWI1_ACIRT|nr:Src kinase-associated phosphoprotein 2 [Acipenser ruthenus]